MASISDGQGFWSLSVFDQSAKAASADMESASDTTNRQLFFLYVGLERAVGARRFSLPPAGVFVPDITAKRRPFAADFTSCRHSLRRLADSGLVKQLALSRGY